MHLVSWAGYSPGLIDGIAGSKTEAAVKAFQKSVGLTDDGVIGPNTFGAVFSLYQNFLDCIMNETSEKTALKNRSNIQWAYPGNKTVGCGSLFPADKVDKENLKSKTGGWLEALFFDPDYIPNCVCKDEPCNSAGCQVYKKNMVVRTYTAPSIPTFTQNEISIEIIEAEDVLFRYNSALMLPSPMPEASDDGGTQVQSTKENPYATDGQLQACGLAVIKGILRYQNLCVERKEQRRFHNEHGAA